MTRSADRAGFSRLLKIAALATALAGAGPAAAADGDPLLLTADLAAEEDVFERMEERLTELGDQLGVHLSRLSFDLVDLRFDARKRLARLKVNARAHDNLRVEVEGDVSIEGSAATVRARVDVCLLGHAISLDLPRFDVAAASVEGRRGVELRLPLLRGEF